MKYQAVFMVDSHRHISTFAFLSINYKPTLFLFDWSIYLINKCYWSFLLPVFHASKEFGRGWSVVRQSTNYILKNYEKGISFIFVLFCVFKHMLGAVQIWSHTDTWEGGGINIVPRAVVVGIAPRASVGFPRPFGEIALFIQPGWTNSLN